MKTLNFIDSHTGGEPTRLVVSGGPDLGHGTLAERFDIDSRMLVICNTVMAARYVLQTAPVARTTPKSTIETPKNTNDQVTTWFRCDARRSASEPAGRNS